LRGNTQALKARLIQDDLGEVFELVEITTLGRSREAVVAVTDPRASRQHALIRRQEDGYWFFDLGSSNGSYLNGRRVTTARILKSGDVIKIGNQQFRFQGDPLADRSRKTSSQRTLIGTRSREALILVSDIQGFTTLSELLPPDALAPIIGSWYSAIGKVLDAHGATLDKFIGDCVLAYWLDTSVLARTEAMRAAWAMRRVAEIVQRDHQEMLARIGLNFRTGAAVHLGPVAYGAISAGEFTLLGDSVNLAFRMEALTREMGKAILVSGEFLDSWDAGKDICEPCGAHQVKGRREPVEVFALEHSPE
jgi:adenylate cyclase